MEKITRHNYEAFYLDYLEGNLNEIDQTMLFDFLDANLDLKSELEDDVLDYALSSDSTSLNTFEKEELKHFDCLKGEICLNNVNDFIIADLEQDISVEKKVELGQFIIEHELEKEKAYFFSTKLNPDLTEVYDDKAGLKRKGTIIPLFLKIASVAAVALLLFNFIGSNGSEDYSPRQSNFALQIDSLNHKFEFNLANNNTSKSVELKEANVRSSDSNGVKNSIHYTEVKIDSIQPTIQDMPSLNNDIVIEKIKPLEKDTVVTPIINEESLFNDDIVRSNPAAEQKDNGIKLVDMYKPITSLTNSYTNLDVSFKKSTEESKYQVTNIKLGKFSFERKKRR